MINLLLGAPGGGKSYEATVYHVLPALQAGRKVVTNLPLNIAAFNAIDPSYGPLIELRPRTLAERPEVGEEDEEDANRLGAMLKAAKAARFRDRAFANPEDYADEWRHPETNLGPLYVIDECHFPLPHKDTARAVEEWYSMHRHFNVDVLLITQSYGKISQAIRDLVQMVYRVRKNVALGSPNSYTRKVQDGLRGEVMNTSIRRYKKEYFQLYRSHTQGQAVNEVNAADVKPLWRHWTFMGAGLCGLILIGMAATGYLRSPLAASERGIAASKAVQPSPQARSAAPGPLAALPTPSASAPVLSTKTGDNSGENAAVEDPEPLPEKGLHLKGMAVLGQGKRSVWIFAVSQNGQQVTTFTDEEIRAAGYEFKPSSACSGVIIWKQKPRPVSCDLPAVQIVKG